MQLTTHFTLEEMIRSDYAIRKGIDNQPSEEIKQNLVMLCSRILEPIRRLFVVPIHVDSGYRSPELNAAIGGSTTSQHMKGQAADITICNITPKELFDLVKKSNIPYDQLIEEFDSWVHVSYALIPRKQCLIAQMENGKTVYLEG